MDEKENIFALYEQVEVKVDLFNVLAKEFKMEATSVKSNWFTTKSIPKSKRARVLQIMQNYIALQNEKSTAKCS